MAPEQYSGCAKADVVTMYKLGIVTGETPAEECFILWGRLINDSFLTARAATLPGPYPKYPCVQASPKSAIATLTAQEKRDLRERVLGVSQMPARS